jgi:hypothetical protein
MKVLLGCLNINGLGGSELYHHELARQLSLLNIDITLFSLRPIDSNNETRQNLNKLNIRQLDLNTLNLQESFDIIVASQPEVNNFFLQYLPNIPLISIIHSEIRSEDPILDHRIKHYIAIRQPIQDMLINHYNIPSDKVSLIYNPIDQTRFNTNDLNLTEKITGIFVGEVLDNIRFKPISHLVNQCIENDWDLWIISKSRYDFNHPNIKYFDPRWDIEILVKQCHFTGGILLGRTTLEGWSCNLPGYMYLIDMHGNILTIESTPPNNIIDLCNSEYVANQHINLYKQIINQ